MMICCYLCNIVAFERMFRFDRLSIEKGLDFGIISRAEYIKIDRMKNVEEILQRNELKNTACRKFIVGELLQSRTAMSEQELKGNSELFDRVTFYRTLKTLEEHDIIHRIVLNDNTVKYALTRQKQGDTHVHSHFHCERCDEVLCLRGKTRFDAELPEGYRQQEVFVVIEGICATCNANA